eukprot:986607-Pleurochrysis_carterae.AAC.2
MNLCFQSEDCDDLSAFLAKLVEQAMILFSTCPAFFAAASPYEVIRTHGNGGAGQRVPASLSRETARSDSGP